MKILIQIILISISILTIPGCTLKTQTDRAYGELGRAEHFHLKKDGYIIGIEKKELRASTNKKYKDKFRPINKSDKISKQRNEKYHSITSNQAKVMIATQITEKISKQKYIYNAYSTNLSGDYDYNSSLAGLDKMFEYFQKQLQNSKRAYTHILIMSMGWNNDQVESLWRYNKILTNIDKSANKHQETFNPLVIAFTWPSSWHTISNSSILKILGHLTSYGNKSNDADEIGYTWANWVLNHKLPKAIKNAKLANPPKTVVIGHSFGARLLSRALFSSSHISSQETFDSVDLFIGLQGAFSANRFIPNGGFEGHPYSGFKHIPTKIVLTSSLHDKANPVAYWVTKAGHVGGHRGLNIANNQKNKDIFVTKVWDKNFPEMDLPNDKILLVDASQIVNSCNDLNLSGHNDILDEEMGDLIWNFISKLDDD